MAVIRPAGRSVCNGVGLFCRWRRRTIYVDSPGVHTLDIWMREDGCMIDRLLLTTNPSYAPSAPDDPPERSMCDLDGDGDVDLGDVAVFAVNFTGSQ